MDIFMVIIGLLAYHCKVMIDQHNADISKNPIKYIKARPVKVVLSVLGAVAGYFITKEGLPHTINGGVALVAYLTAGLVPYAIFDKYGKTASKPEEKPVEPKFHKIPKEDDTDMTQYWKEK